MYLTKSGVFCSSLSLLCISEDIKKPLHLSFSSLRIAADLCALPLCPAYMEKAILTVGDKRLPNKTQASVGERKRVYAASALSPCSHVLFVHWGGGSISCFTSSCRAASPLHRLLLSSLHTLVVKSSVRCAIGLALHPSDEGVRCYKQGAERNKSEQRSEAWDMLFPGYFPFFVSGLPPFCTLL